MEMRENVIVNIDNLFCKVSKLWTKTKKQILDNCGLTYSQFEILSAIHYLTANQQEIIQIDLSGKTGIDPMTTSTILRNLERKKLIIRLRGIENTRVVNVKLTPEGYQAYKRAFGSIISLNKSLYKRIDKNNLAEQLRLLSEELHKINN